MKKHMFKVGDRVVATKDHPEKNPLIYLGMSGTIVHIHLSEPAIGVEWDNVTPGPEFHSCSGHIKERRGWYVNVGDVDFECEEINAPVEDFTAFLLS